MKKTILSISIGLLLLTGCSKENVDPQIEQRTGDTFYVFNNNGEDSTWEEIAVDEFQSTNSKTGVTAPNANRGNSTHTHGSLDLGDLQMTWSGTENDGGTHGSATLSQEFAPGLGVNVTMETSCVNSIGNEAVYVGRITDNDNATGFFAFLFAVGNKVSLKVIDNGEGNNAQADQFAGLGISIGGPFGPEPQVCESLGQPDSEFWGQEPIDIESPGSVKINN